MRVSRIAHRVASLTICFGLFGHVEASPHVLSRFRMSNSQSSHIKEVNDDFPRWQRFHHLRQIVVLRCCHGTRSSRHKLLDEVSTALKSTACSILASPAPFLSRNQFATISGGKTMREHDFILCKRGIYPATVDICTFSTRDCQFSPLSQIDVYHPLPMEWAITRYTWDGNSWHGTDGGQPHNAKSY